MEITFGSKKHNDPKTDAKKGGGSGLGGLFASKPEGQNIPPELTDEINNIARRLKLLEEHFTILRRKLDVTERNVMSRTKSFTGEIKTVNSELSELRQTLNKVEDKVLIMIKEFQLTAKKEDLEVLKKFVDMWAPIKFVTRDEVERIVAELIDDKLNR